MNIAFLPWLRDGLSGSIATTDDDARAVNRAQLAAAITLSTGAHPPTQAVSLYGPGDVGGFEPSLVVRTDPPAGSTSHEPTRFVLAELGDPTAAWSFTPTAPTTAQRLRPWLTLVVVRQQDGVTLAPGSQPQMSVLTIIAPAQPAAELPDPATLWAWAHVQVVLADADEAIADAVATPGAATSRLMATRALDPGTTYLACLVPTFAAGAQAALGQPVDPAAALAPAWRAGDTAVTLPVYYSWSFTTGAAGDFLTLASLLHPAPVPKGVGVRTLDVSSVGGDTISIGGALQSPGLEWPVLPAAVGATLATQVSGSGPDVRPPLYGSTYAGVTELQAGASGWLAELNLDPAARVAAGLGASVVAGQQDALVGSAWQQAGDITAANQLLDRARLSQAVTQAVHDRHLSPLSDDVLLQVTAPAHDRIRMADSRTVGAALRDDVTTPPAAYSYAFTRLSAQAPLSRAAARQSVADGATASRAAAAFALSNAATVDDEDGDGGQPQATVIDGRFSADLLARLDAAATVPARVAPQVRAQPGAAGPGRLGPAPVIGVAGGAPDPNAAAAAQAAGGPVVDPLTQQLFGPSYPTPLYTAAAQTAPELVLPGAELIGANTVTLLEANPRFATALLVGANGELERDLVWQGFPVDRRATYFQSFWDDSASTTPGPDITPIATWSSNSTLEQAAAGPGPGLVLVVRGELLRRYPTALVFAVRAVTDDNGNRMPSTNPGDVQQPLFSGSLVPDLQFFGFGLTKDQAHTDNGLGWFFAFQERLTETRFGLESGTVDLSSPSTTSANVAANTLRPAVEVAIHADDLLPAP